MLNSQNVDENLNCDFNDLDLFDYFSLLKKNDEYFNNNEFKLIGEENISFFNQIKNKSKKKEIVFNIKKISNKESKKKEIKSSNDSKNNKIITSMIRLQKFNTQILSDVAYRKDAYYKHFKVNLGKFIRDRLN